MTLRTPGSGSPVLWFLCAHGNVGSHHVFVEAVEREPGEVVVGPSARVGKLVLCAGGHAPDVAELSAELADRLKYERGGI